MATVVKPQTPLPQPKEMPPADLLNELMEKVAHLDRIRSLAQDHVNVERPLQGKTEELKIRIEQLSAEILARMG